MMALKSPMLPSPNGALVSAFSPYSDSPNSPSRFDSPIHRPMSTDNTSRLNPPLQFPSHASSPTTDIADPSPITTSSSGTDGTDIEDTAIESEGSEASHEVSDTEEQQPSSQPTPKWPIVLGNGERASLHLETKNAAAEALKSRSDEDSQPSSVIHAPQGFDAFHRQSPPSIRRTTPTPSQRSEPTVIVSPAEDESDIGVKSTRSSNSPMSPPFIEPIQTAVPPARDWSATPRAQTRPEIEASSLEPDARKVSSRSSSRSSNLEDIPEGQDTDVEEDDHGTFFNHTIERFQETKDEVAALNIALSECWTLCNTLAGLSYIHRERIFSFSGKGDRQEQAWKSCWKLCQKLYETRDEEITNQVRPTLDLCREFCQCLFDVRQRENEKADSVLRVSFELNNHLYNTHDRNLPEAFRERTLDFYITLCHRLMKQRTELARETDSLLAACWSLAEMLFSLRQNKREGKAADEELLGSAVQACWELCDLFREGWTQVRPDRGTPRPSQTTFTQAFHQAKQSQTANAQWTRIPNEPDESEDEDFGRANPETPTTIFEDTHQMSPDESLPPNILVLGPDHTRPQPQAPRRHHHASQYSSGSSTLSGYTLNSRTTTSSNSTIINSVAQTPPPTSHPSSTQQMITEDPHLTCLKLLVVKAATNAGYTRPRSPSLSRSPPSVSTTSTSSNLIKSSSTGSTAAQPLTFAAFVKTLPSNSFGSQHWQIALLDSYKKLIASDPTFASPSLNTLNNPAKSSSSSSASSVSMNSVSSSASAAGLGIDTVLGPNNPPRRARASDVARSVQWMVGGHAGRYAWLRDLYRLVFGFRVEEGEGRTDVLIQS